MDLLCVVLFALVGMTMHDSPLSGFVATVWPFAVGLLLAWFVPAVRGMPLLPWPTGVLVWAGTAGVGLVLRAVTGGGVSGAFPWVAAGVLAALLLGWRLVLSLLGRRRRTA
ncbi:DUF3054 domain-containing protein [Georgenia sp. 10Sc9-8]|uniref:DUF3054 domain-containing protein n=1 Tax=Georgenia halotolerans TaxID=3028317 RepID=A0ABT5TX34_9MICO|nr:DUF3054 domain-containing protein [Georgenia halotolerans]